MTYTNPYPMVWFPGYPPPITKKNILMLVRVSRANVERTNSLNLDLAYLFIHVTATLTMLGACERSERRTHPIPYRMGRERSG